MNNTRGKKSCANVPLEPFQGTRWEAFDKETFNEKLCRTVHKSKFLLFSCTNFSPTFKQMAHPLFCIKAGGGRL
jgi:hypothetical protein